MAFTSDSKRSTIVSSWFAQKTGAERLGLGKFATRLFHCLSNVATLANALPITVWQKSKPSFFFS
jgi:hypothetical protein